LSIDSVLDFLGVGIGWDGMGLREGRWREEDGVCGFDCVFILALMSWLIVSLAAGDFLCFSFNAQTTTRLHAHLLDDL
jgi:hypothetical protein